MIVIGQRSITDVATSAALALITVAVLWRFKKCLSRSSWWLPRSPDLVLYPLMTHDLIATDVLLTDTRRHRMKWVTRERPKIDRIACPWLIARFIDEEA